MLLEQRNYYMQDYICTIEKSGLFAGISRQGIEELLLCVQARIAFYKAGETIIYEGDYVEDIGIVISGSAQSVMSDPMGNITIITHVEAGGFIGIFLAADHNKRSPVSVIAKKFSSVLFIPFMSITGRCEKNCDRHDILIRNCLNCIAEKSLLLHDRINCLIRPTLRGKITTFLNQQARGFNSSSFTVPFDRSDMAAYINVDRSALSRELSRMKRDGLIDYHKSSFKLY